MMQQSPRLYASPHACPLRVAALPPEGAQIPLGRPCGRLPAPTLAHCVWLRSVRPELVEGSLSKGARRRELVEGGI